MTFEVGQAAKIREYYDEECFGTILRIFQRGDRRDAYMRVRWYYKPSDVFNQSVSWFGKYELFDSDHEQDIWVQCVYDIVKVLSFEEYHRLDEVEDDNVYYSRARYLTESGALEPPMETWPTVCVCETIVNPDIVYLRCSFCDDLFHLDCIYEPIDKDWTCALCAEAKRRYASL